MKAEELKQMVTEGKPVRIIDVREPDEFRGGDKIEGAENIPMGRVFADEMKGKFSKGERLVTVCKSGVRCEIVARELRNKGYDIDYLEGGVDAWAQQH